MTNTNFASCTKAALHQTKRMHLTFKEWMCYRNKGQMQAKHMQEQFGGFYA